MDAFQFLRPAWLLALPVGGLLAWRLIGRARRSAAWLRVCDPALLPHLLVGEDTVYARWPYWIFACGWVLAVLALAGPSWDRQSQPVYRNLAGRVIVLDLSKSMDAADLKPSRLVLARFKVADLLSQPFDGQYGLVVFAGDAFAVAPLTHDTRTLRNLLPALVTNVMPVQGGRAGRGLEQAEQLLAQSGVQGGQIVLITDAIDSGARDTAARLYREGIRTHVLGVGTAQGGPIPNAGGGFFKDASGSIVLPKLDTDALRGTARAGGGAFATIAVDDSDVAAVLSAMDGVLGIAGDMADTRLETERFNDRGPLLVLVLLPLAALAFRRGWLTLVLLLCWAMPPPVQALTWESLWWRPDQRAARALDKGDIERAAVEHAAPAWQGSALYRAERFGDAERAFSRNDNSVSHYNRGNALARQGKLQQAIDAYDTALTRQPEFADALHNREIVKRALRQQPPPSGQDASKSDGRPDSESEAEQEGGEAEADKEAARNSEAASSSRDPEPAVPDDTSASRQARPDDSGSTDIHDEPSSSRAPAPSPPSEAADGARPQDVPNPAQADASDDDSSGTDDDPGIDQWLRRIPDDPGGLLRRKLRLQYQRRSDRLAAGEQAW